MQLPDYQPEALSSLALEIRAQIQEILKFVKPVGDTIVMGSTDDIFIGQQEDIIFLVKSGQVQCRQQNKLIYSAESGDLVGLFRAQNLLDGQFEIAESAQLIPYSLSVLQEVCNENNNLQLVWAQFLLGLSCFFNQALAYEIPKQFKPATGFLQFEEGDVIINQGEQAECVYTLLEGSADVTRDGIKVGEIQAEETFGAMALFTKQPRNATVTATSSCSVLAVRKDEFMDLVSHQPQVCMGLIEEMADKINLLNQKVLNLQ